MTKWVKTIDIKVLLAFAAVYIIWGTTYLAIKIGLQDMPPFLMASFRFLIAGTVLIVFCLIKEGIAVNKEIFQNMLLGALMLTLGQGVIFWAEQFLSSGLTAVFIALLPICYIVADKRNWKSYFNSKLTIVSITMGLLGILILFKDQTTVNGEHSVHMRIIASIAVICSCLFWAIGSLYYKYNFAGGSLFWNIGWQLMGGAITCFCINLITGEWTTFTFTEVSLNGWLAVSYLAIAGSVVAFTASYYLLSIRPAAVVGTYAYVNPIIAVLLGSLVANETITVSQVIGIVIILIAAYLSNKVKLKA